MDSTVLSELRGVWELYIIGFVLLSLVFSTQTGLSLIEAGYSRKLHYAGVLIKNLHQFAIGILVWWLVGFGFSFSQVEGEFIGKRNFGGQNWDDSLNYLHAALYGFIGLIVVFSVNNAVLERVQFYIYFIIAGLIMGFVYPVIVAWSWGGGWLASSKYPLLDYGGAGTIHILSGAMALVGAIVSGERTGKVPFSKNFHPASYPMAIAGYFLFIVGLIFINGLQAPDFIQAGNALFNSMLGGGVCCLTVYILATLYNRQVTFAIDTGLQGFLAGVIALSSVGQRTEGWDAVCIGWFVGLFVAISIRLVMLLEIDDPANHISAQLVPGFVGLILVGVFDNEQGIFHNSDGSQLGYQVLGAVVILAWGTVWGLIFFGIPRALGLLRVTKEMESIPMMRWGLGFDGFNVVDYKSMLQHNKAEKPYVTDG